jgi:hypothetical protein
VKETNHEVDEMFSAKRILLSIAATPTKPLSLLKRVKETNHEVEEMFSAKCIPLSRSATPTKPLSLLKRVKETNHEVEVMSSTIVGRFDRLENRA